MTSGRRREQYDDSRDDAGLPPQSFNFNGAWEGHALAHLDAHVRPAPQH